MQKIKIAQRIEQHRYDRSRWDIVYITKTGAKIYGFFNRALLGNSGYVWDNYNSVSIFHNLIREIFKKCTLFVRNMRQRNGSIYR
jgi:hypothetical protein